MRDGPSSGCGRRDDVDVRDVQTMLGELATLGLARQGLGLELLARSHPKSLGGEQRRADARASAPSPHPVDRRACRRPGEREARREESQTQQRIR